MERHNNGRTLWNTENKSNEFVIPQKRCERQWSIAKYFLRAQALPVLFSGFLPPIKPLFGRESAAPGVWRTFRGPATAWNSLYWWKIVVACKEGILWSPVATVFKDGSFPSLTECAICQPCCLIRTTLGEAWGTGCAPSTAAETLYSPVILHRLVCPAPSAFLLTLTERKKERLLLAKVQPSKMELRGLGEPMVLNKSGVFVSSQRVWISNWMQFYKCLPLCWPWCVLWESTIQAVLHVTSLVSHLFWNKSKYGAVPSAKWSLWFLFLPKRGRRGPTPGCLCHIAELALPLIFRQERGEFRVQPTLQYIQSSTPDDFSKQ